VGNDFFYRKESVGMVNYLGTLQILVFVIGSSCACAVGFHHFLFCMYACMHSYQNMYLVCWSLARSIGKSSSDVCGLERLTVGELFLDEMTIYRETKEFTELLGVALRGS
jgi:hypothetical protein